MRYTVVILVGEESTKTQFNPLTIDQPKVLYPLGGSSLLNGMIEALIAQLGEVIDQILLLGSFKNPHVFDGFLQEMCQTHSTVGFKYLHQPSTRTTTSAFYDFREQVFQFDTNGLILVYGDVICDYPFKDMCWFHEQNDAKLTVLGTNPLLLGEYLKKYLMVRADDFDNLTKSNFGPNFDYMVSKKGDSKICRFYQKNSNESVVKTGKTFDISINGGIWVFDNCALKVIMDMTELISSDSTINRPKSPKGSTWIEWETLRYFQQKTPEQVMVYKTNQFWYHVKTPLSALLANNFLLSMGKTNYHQQYNNHNIGPNVSIGNNVKIGTGVRIKNAIIGDEVVIGNNTLIANAIISKGVFIGEWCRIEGSFNNYTLSNDIIVGDPFGEDHSTKGVVVLKKNAIVTQDKFIFNSTD